MIAIAILFALAHSACPMAHMHGPMPTGHVKNRTRNECIDQTHRFVGDDADNSLTTVQGCKCASTCGATADDFDGNKCDWCYTTNNCGHYSSVRRAYYDYCVYKQNDESGNWMEKENAVWQKVLADKTPGEYPSIAGMFLESVITSFDDRWDEMPDDRQKFIHSQGVVCLVNMEMKVDGYTGIFKRGIAHGMIRMGSALNMGSLEIFPSATVPGNGFKFFRTGLPSANWVTLFTLDGQKEYNFFVNNQSNHIPMGGVKTLGLVVKFGQASKCATMVGLSDAAKYDQVGNEASTPVFPYQLVFAPRKEAASYVANSKMTGQQMLQQMSTIAPNTPLFDVYAKRGPNDQPSYAGVVTSTSQCTSSNYGDTKLFFQHQRIEEDLQLRPDWVSQIDNAQWLKDCACNSVDVNPPENCEHKTTAIDFLEE